MYFYVPPTLSTDFAEMLVVFGEQVTVNIDSATPTTGVYVQLSNPNFKSNYQNLLDNARILRFALTTDIKKGDYLTTSGNKTYIVTWGIYRDVNSCKSQCQLCNVDLTFQRFQEAVLNNTTGVQATPAQYISIAENIACFTTRTGMGIFSSSAGDIGIVPLNKLLIGMQYNSETSLLQIDDEFDFHDIRYQITDIDLAMLEDGETTGIIAVHAQKRASGDKVTP